MADLNVAVQIVGQDSASGPVGKVSDSLQRLSVSASESTGILGRFGSILSSIGQQAVAFAAGFVLFDVISKGFNAVSDAAIGFNAHLEQSQVAWSVFLKSGDAANAMLSQLEHFAAGTPFRFQGIEDDARLLMAMGINAKDLIPTLTDIGNAAAATGKGAEGFDQISYAIGQMQSIGKVTARDMMELAMAGIPAWQILADAMGKSTAEVRKLSEAGQITSDVFLNAFHQFVQNNWGDMMQRQSQTFLGALTTIQDNVQIVASTAFKPLFDRIADVARQIEAFTQSDTFQSWGAKVAAVVDVVLSSLGTLTTGFFDALSSILSITMDLGQAIYEALSWLNPFATHSPSLVSQVNDGVNQIVQKYQDLGLIAAPVTAAGKAIQSIGADTSKTGIDNLKESVSTLKDRADLLTSALNAAHQKLTDLTNTPIQGEGAFSDKAFAIQQQINAKQLQLTNLQLSHGPEIGRSQLEKQIQLLELQKQQVDLQSHVQFDPLHRQIQQAANPQQEQPFAKILQGVKDAQKDIATLGPAAQAATNIYKAQEQYLQQVQAAASKAAAAIGDVGKAAGGVGDLSFLDKAKAQLADFNKQFAEDRAKIIEQAKPFTDAINGIAGAMERFAAIAERIHSQGLAGGLTELLFPSEGPANSTDALMNQMGGVVNGIQHPSLAWDQIGTEIGRRVGMALSYAVDKIDWAAIGERISSKLTVTVGAIDWKIVIDQAAIGPNLTTAFLTTITDHDFTPVGRALADKLVGVFDKPIQVPNADFVLNAVHVAFPLQTLTIDIANTIGKAGAQVVAGFFEELAKLGFQNIVEPLLSNIQTQVLQPVIDVVKGPKISESGTGMIDALVKNAQDSTKKHTPDLIQMAQDVVNGLAGGMNDRQDILAQATRDLAQKGTIDPFKTAIDAHSPSQVFYQFGQWIDQGLAAGITSQLDQVASAALSLGQVIRDALQSGIGTLDLKISMALQNGAATIGSATSSAPTFAAQHSPHARIGALAGATGLNFIVGGSGGIDSQFVPMMLTPGEHVITTPPGQSGARALTISAPLIGQIVVRNDADLEAIKKKIASLPAEISAMFEADARSALGQGNYSPVGIQVSY